jgi:Acetyltransferase (GNAT) family
MSRLSGLAGCSTSLRLLHFSRKPAKGRIRLWLIIAWGENDLAVRPFGEHDIPQVADLFWTVMRGRKGSAPPAVQSFFQQLYFASPWVDSSIPSLVYEGKTGRIVGFLGVIVRKMSACGQPIRVAFGGNFVVDPEARSNLAGTRLLGTYMAGEQDLSQTDSANNVSRNLLEKLGFRTIVPFSIHWARPLRPGHYAVYAVSRLTGPMLSASLNLAAKPFSSLVDSMAARFNSSPFRRTEPVLHGEELDVETLLQCINKFRNGYSLWPEYDLPSLTWLLGFIERMQTRGDLRKVVLRDDSQKILGWYIYYVKPGAVGEVVQIGGERNFTKDILDHLFYDAWNHGVVGLHGVVNSRLMGDFSDKDCFFTCRGGWTVAHSRKPELLELLNRGDAFLSRLDGEWCLAFGG